MKNVALMYGKKISNYRLGNNYRSAFKQKISVTLFKKELKPSFNVKKKIDSVTPL